MNFFTIVLENSVPAISITIICLAFIHLYSNKISSIWKYRLLKFNLLFYILPIYMICGEVINSLGLIDFNLIEFNQEKNYFAYDFVYNNEVENIDFEFNYNQLTETNIYNSDEFILNDLVVNNKVDINTTAYINNAIVTNTFDINYFFMIWKIGVLLGSIWLTYCYFRCNFEIKKSDFIEDNQCIDILEEVKSELKIKSKINLVLNKNVTSPMLFGLFNAKIIMPSNNLKNEFLKYIFTHELIHFKRKDLFVKIILIIVTILNWFNPCIYILGKNINKYLEYSCDEEVVKYMNKEQKKIYGLTILEYTSNYKFNHMALALTSKKEKVKERLENMLKQENKKISKFAKCVVGVAFATAVTIPAITYSYNKNISNEIENNNEEFKPLLVDPIDTFDPVFDKSGLSGEEYSKHIIESLLSINSNNIDFDKAKIISQKEIDNVGLMRENVLNTLFYSDDYNTFISSYINEETFQIYQVSKGRSGEVAVINIDEVSEELSIVLLSKSNEFLNNIGLTMYNKQIEFYKSDDNDFQRSISVVLTDDFGNTEFIFFVYPVTIGTDILNITDKDCENYELLSYEYFDANNSIIQSYMNHQIKLDSTLDENYILTEKFNQLDYANQSADGNNILNLIETIAIAPRPVGSERQLEVSKFCFDLLKTYGYEVELQEYPFKMLSVQEISTMTNAPFNFSTDTDMTGVNIIAKKTGNNSSDKTIVVSTSIDSLSTNNGVTDNATGMSAVLELANMLQNVPTDTDVIFALFSGDNNASYGARYYVSQLEQNELDKMININIDTIGEKSNTFPQLGTIDGISNEVTDLLSDYISDVTKGGLSNYIAFEYADVPTISIIQYPDYPQNIDSLNSDGEVDVDKILDVTNMLYEVIISK